MRVKELSSWKKKLLKYSVRCSSRLELLAYKKKDQKEIVTDFIQYFQAVQLVSVSGREPEQCPIWMRVQETEEFMTP